MGDENTPQAPAATPPPAPVAPATPEIPLAGGAKMLEAAATQAGLSASELEAARDRLKKMHEDRKTEHLTATRESLAGLAAQVRQGRPADSSESEKVNSVLLTVERELALAAFKENDTTKKIDFTPDSFSEACRVLQQEIFSFTDPSFPVEFQVKWMKLVAESFAKQLDEKDPYGGDINFQHIKEAKKEVLEAFGEFKEWFKKQPEYAAWETSAEAARKAKEAEGKAKTDAEAAAKTAADAAAAEAQKQADAAALVPPPVPPESPEEMTVADKLKAQVDGMEEGKLKTSLSMALGALTAALVKLTEIPFIGDWIRGNFISNKMLAAELKDKPDKQELYEKARQTAALEDEFARFGLPRKLARELAGKKTKDVIATFEQKPEDATEDAKNNPALQEKLKYVAGELKRKNGAASEATLMAFINDAAWRTGGVKYGVPAPLSGAIPAAAPATAPATAPETPVETAFNTAIDTALSAHYGKPIDLASAPFSFTLPYTEGDQVKTVPCSIHGNEVTVDGKKYTLNLPSDAKLKTITIANNTSATLSVKAEGLAGGLASIASLVGPDPEKISVKPKDLLKALGKLQAAPPTLAFGIGDKQATFTKVA